MIKKITKLMALILGLVILTGAVLVYNNNRQLPPPSAAELNAALDKSIHWLLANRSQILSQKNSILIWMLSEGGHRTGDQRLQKLAAEYVQAMPVFSPWQFFFNSNSLAPLKPEHLGELPDYNLLFLYGLSCDQTLGELDIVRRQQEENFCRDNHPFGPACLTHQLMGLRFMQRRGCGPQAENVALIATIQDKIERQLTWDPRVVDVYIQRVLMLVESGAPERVKPVWLRNVLKAQLPDGGWGGFQPLIPVSASRYLGFSQKLIGLGRPTSNLHATAQGVLLLSLLTEKKARSAMDSQAAN